MLMLDEVLNGDEERRKRCNGWSEAADAWHWTTCCTRK